MSLIEGGCFCGNIRYEITLAEYPVASCHCSMCRKTSGAPYVAWLIVPKTSFNYTGSSSLSELKSSEGGRRSFCNQCGTPVTCVNAAHPDIIDVTVGSLDEPGGFKPTMQAFEDSRLPWS
jgi:hypothetical protein